MVWAAALLLRLASVLAAAVAATPDALPGCRAKCGNVTIPYPFGIGGGCFMEGFDITCNESVPYLSGGNIDVLEIQLFEGLLVVNQQMAYDCYSKDGKDNDKNRPYINIAGMPYKFSGSRNKFMAVGCDTVAYFGDDESGLQAGCFTSCNSTRNIPNDTCSGIGCCETPIPKGLTAFEVNIVSIMNHTNCWDFNPCSYAFLADEGWLNFGVSSFSYLSNVTNVPLTLDWAIGNRSCEEASTSSMAFACKAKHSRCLNSTNGPGYRCNCLRGFEGNPYIEDGCRDINECEHPEQYPCNGTCLNSLGSYTCKCPEGTHGDALIEAGCTKDKSVLGAILITGGGVGAGILLLLGSSVLISRKLKERNVKKRKKGFFRENKGLLLQQLVSSDETLVERMKIFTLEELEKATNNFDSARVVGKGGHGTVYKGILSDQRVVAIKKSKIANRAELDQFINEMVILSQIIHRNVVKLFGCCLESKVPLLVYEFISGGTLFNHLHDNHHFAPLSWQDRLRIAAEIAGALSYLHFAASISIFHRDVKSSNILLNESYTAKVSDFGASRPIPLNRTCVTTAVQGTYGYLDPQYHQTGQLTEKSDVYSFGVILLELLTGKDPISYSRHQQGTLTLDFICSLRENNLFDILDPQISEEGGEEDIEIVAHLTELCLRLKGEERPTMREVEQKLDTMRRFAKSEHDFDVSQNGGMTTSLPSIIPVEGNASSTTRQYSLEKEFMASLVEQPR